MNTVLPTQIGYIPLPSVNISGSASGQITVVGNPSTEGVSSVVMGRSTGSWEAVGVGKGGRPDILNNLLINLTNSTVSGGLTMPGIVNIDVQDLVSVIASRGSRAPKQFNFKMREVSVCEQNDAGNSEEKKMMILASQTYPLPSGSR